MTAPQQKMDHHELFPRSQIKAGVINHFGAKQWFAVDSVKWKKKEKKRSQARNWAVTVYCSLETRRENQSSYIWKKQPTLMEKSADTPSARRVLVVLDSQSDCLFKNSPFTKIPQHIFHPLVRSDTVSGRCTKLWGSEKANRVQKESATTIRLFLKPVNRGAISCFQRRKVFSVVDEINSPVLIELMLLNLLWLNPLL